ncbi:hypothetical protein E2562_025021 [Oryza meyeriana var. granulata]|uniref:Uncharacterized protein n=1 Tax=Oryza meyeriana var. granulata TaxID=110450 RepID=A0A6G1FBZ6_9ORYZ|nr:hypothetical protein E2562_025021 [Oryza meyeriana var. granulata]
MSSCLFLSSSSFFKTSRRSPTNKRVRLHGTFLGQWDEAENQANIGGAGSEQVNPAKVETANTMSARKE